MSGPPPGIRDQLEAGMAQQGRPPVAPPQPPQPGGAPNDIAMHLDTAIKVLTGLKMAIATNPQVAQQIAGLVKGGGAGGPPMPPPGMPPQ
jgi:hypothetical protein